MKLKNAKTCGDCRAYASGPFKAARCDLGFKTYTIKTPPPWSLQILRPAEPCWKPTTVKEYVECLSYPRPHSA